MSRIGKIKEKGISLKFASGLMLIISIIVTAALIFASIRAFISFRALEQSTEVYIHLEEQATSLMEASDFLTEQVQCFAILGERKYMDHYFEEVISSRRRENAIEYTESLLPGSLALYELKDSMRHSEHLMEREYYSMRLVLDSLGDTDIPEQLKDVVIKDEDAILSNKEKAALAVEMVHDSQYYFEKSEIRRNLNDCLRALKNSTFDSQQSLDNISRRSLISIMVLILIQAVSVCVNIWLHTNLGINPLLKAVEHIKKDEKIPVIGSEEFRYLAGTYNVMFNAYKKSISQLNFKASHDELTGIYNRSGYEIIKTNLDISSTALMIIDADKFKEINDTYGHETGDEVLKRIANVLKKSFRSNDYICRIGGDEFVVFMVNIPDNPDELIENKIAQINDELSRPIGNIPAVTLSVGIAYDENETDGEKLFSKADAALYYVKRNGRNGSCIYSKETI